MIATFDANTLVSSSVAKSGGTLNQIVDAWRRREFEVVISEHIFAEISRALADRYFQERLTANQT